MLELKRHYDAGSLVVIAVTFILFVSAVFTKGFTHDILLEAAVFLVSVKLIIMAYKNIDETDSLHKKLDDIYIYIYKSIQSNPTSRKKVVIKNRSILKFLQCYTQIGRLTKNQADYLKRRFAPL